MDRRIMVLGAGVYQVPLIRKVREKGLECLVVSPEGNYPGIQLADIYLDLDTTDSEGIVNAAKEHGVIGVVTTGTDVSIPSVGAVVDALGLKGPTQIAAQTVSSKTAFRSFLKTNKHNCPEFRICYSDHDVVEFRKGSNTKIVVKPDDSSGSRGITVVSPDQPVEKTVEAYFFAKKHSRSGLVCAEEFVPGFEIGGDAFLVDGSARFFTTTTKHVHGVLVQGHSLPGPLTRIQKSIVKREIEKVAKGLGYENGPINFDVMVNEDRSTILEMGLRNGGNGIVDLIFHSYGIDLLEWLLDYIQDKPIYQGITSIPKEVSSYVFGSETSGKLVGITGLKELRAFVPEVFGMTLAKKNGDDVEPFVHNANLIGYLMINCGPSDYYNMISQVNQFLEVRVE